MRIQVEVQVYVSLLIRHHRVHWLALLSQIVSTCLNLLIASEMRSHIFESNGELDIE